jgi:polar amino acid transport system substrate-binding protein
MRKPSLNRRCVHAAIGALLLVTTACTGEVSARVSPSTRGGDHVDTLLPASIRDANLIRIGADASTPPYLFVNKSGELAGLEFDFMQALSDEIGVPIQVVATSFSGLVPSLLSGRIDAGMSNFSDTVEREEQVDFVDYTRSADRIMVGRGNPHDISTTEDLCGLRVSATQGTTSAAGTAESSDECVAQGRSAITILLVPSLGDTLIQVQSGRADALVTDQAQVVFQQQQTDGLVEPTGDLIGPNFHGVATRKGNSGLRDTFLQAFEELFANGTYDRILEKWDQPQLRIDAPTINAEGKDE